jgi:hypothetical protein
MNILVAYRGAPRIRGWETGAMVADAFRDLSHEVDEYGFVYETKESINSPTYHPEKHYDLVLIMEHNDPDPQPFELVNQPCDRRVYWTFDISYKTRFELSNIARFQPDHVFCANYYLCPMIVHFLNIETTFLPYAACLKRHFRDIDPAIKKYDITLVGTERPDRLSLVETLQKAGLDARLISDVFKEDYITAMAESRVVINQNPPEGRGLMNMRQFEAPAAGALLLTSAGDGLEQIRIPCHTYYPGYEALAAEKLFPFSFDLEALRNADQGS